MNKFRNQKLINECFDDEKKYALTCKLRDMSEHMNEQEVMLQQKIVH